MLYQFLYSEKSLLNSVITSRTVSVSRKNSVTLSSVTLHILEYQPSITRNKHPLLEIFEKKGWVHFFYKTVFLRIWCFLGSTFWIQPICNLKRSGWDKKFRQLILFDWYKIEKRGINIHTVPISVSILRNCFLHFWINFSCMSSSSLLISSRDFFQFSFRNSVRSLSILWIFCWTSSFMHTKMVDGTEAKINY